MLTVEDAPLSTRWGLLVRQIRKEQSVSQRELAKLAGVHRSSLRRLEDGKTSGTMDMLELIVGALGYEFELMQMKLPDGFDFAPPPRDPSIEEPLVSID